MKRLLNVLGYLVSDLTQRQLAERGACRCHKFRSGGFGMELHTYGQALWNAKNITGSACVAVSRNWIWDPDETLFNLPRDKFCSKHLVGAEPQRVGLPLAGRARVGHAGRRLRDHVGLELVAAHGGAVPREGPGAALRDGRRDAVAAARLVVAAMAPRVYISLNKGV